MFVTTMTNQDDVAPGNRRGASVPDVLLALGVIGLGVFFAVGAFSVNVDPGYARVGPRFFPFLVAGGLIVVGGLMLVAALRGQRTEPAAEEDADPDAPPSYAAFGWISLGIVLDIVLLNPLGFVIASSVLFACTARGFRSTNPVRDLLGGLMLSLVAYVVFTRGLGLSLPPGVLRGVL